MAVRFIEYTCPGMYVSVRVFVNCVGAIGVKAELVEYVVYCREKYTTEAAKDRLGGDLAELAALSPPLQAV